MLLEAHRKGGSPYSGRVLNAYGKGRSSGLRLDLNYAALSSLTGRETFTRSSSTTDLRYTASSGTYNTFSSNVPMISSSGLLLRSSRTQYLGATDSPATQTVTLSTTGKYTCWMIGSGSVAVSAGTATITGAGSATQGTPLTFTVTAAGTVTFTVTGTVTRFQCENSALATNYIPNAGAAGTTVTRAADICSIPTSAFGFNPVAATLLVEFQLDHPQNTNLSFCALSLDDATTNNRLEISTNNNPEQICIVMVTGGVVKENSNSVATGITAGPHKVAYAYSDTTRSACANGGTVMNVSSLAFPSAPTALHIGCKNDLGTQIEGWIKRVRVWNFRQPDSILQSLTT